MYLTLQKETTMNPKTKRWLFAPLTAVVIANTAAAQVPVNNEAHHKVVLENAYVRVLEGRIAAHDTTPPHIHAANSVVIFLSASTFGIAVAGQQPVITDVKPGDTKYVDYGDKPVTHIVWNQSQNMFHFLVVELKHPQEKPIESKYIDLAAGGDYHLSKSSHARFLVAITGTPRALRPDGFLFIPPQSELTLDGAGSSRCLMLELD
jgi:hypothetical protein